MPSIDWPQVGATLQALTVLWFQPLNVVLLVGIVMVGRFMRKANERSDFFLVDALRGPDGKASMKLIFYMVAGILGSWVLMYCATDWRAAPDKLVQAFGIYMVVMIAPHIAGLWIQGKYGPGKKDDDRDRDRGDVK